MDTTTNQMPATAPVMPEPITPVEPAFAAPPVAPAMPAPVIEQTPPKKKSNTALIVVGIIAAVGLLCCGLTVAGIFLLKGAVQNAPQSAVVTEFFEAADSGDALKVRSLTDPDFYTILTRQYDEGTPLGLLKNNVESITITGLNIDNDIAIVNFILVVKKNKDLYDTLEAAEVKKDSAGNWIITDMGQASGSSESD